MSELNMNDKMTLVQYAIEKYENEEELLSKLSSVLPLYFCTCAPVRVPLGTRFTIKDKPKKSQNIENIILKRTTKRYHH